MKTIEHEGVYFVGDDNVRLTVTIGEGQFGSVRVIAGGKLFPHERTFDQTLGSGKDLKGTELVIASVVTDTNRQTNRTSVSYRLTGGPTEWRQTLTFTVDNEGDSVHYIAKIALRG